MVLTEAVKREADDTTGRAAETAVEGRAHVVGDPPRRETVVVGCEVIFGAALVEVTAPKFEVEEVKDTFGIKCCNCGCFMVSLSSERCCPPVSTSLLVAGAARTKGAVEIERLLELTPTRPSLWPLISISV